MIGTIQRMTDTDKKICYLYKQGYNQKEIAARLDVKYSYVKARIGKMRKSGFEVKRWSD